MKEMIEKLISVDDKTLELLDTLSQAMKIQQANILLLNESLIKLTHRVLELEGLGNTRVQEFN